MSNPYKPSLALLVKLGSIVVHAEETFSDDGRQVDRNVTVSLIEDAEVQEWIKQMGALLPLRRIEKPEQEDKL